MRAAIALLLLTSACFPESARHRRYAKIGEGLAIAGGIALNLLANENDCMSRRPGAVVEDCNRTIAQLDTVGVILIFAGLAGFAATTISANRGGEPDNDDERRDMGVGDGGVFAAPQAFCPAMWAGNIAQAEAALGTYVKSVGARGPSATADALHAWLSRQTCVTVEDEFDAVVLSIRIRVSVREMHYRIDVSASPFIVIVAEESPQ